MLHADSLSMCKHYIIFLIQSKKSSSSKKSKKNSKSSKSTKKRVKREELSDDESDFKEVTLYCTFF